jgi:ATP-dependent DNA ligase
MIPVDLMVPTTAATLPIGDAWVYEPKWDGYRAAAMKVGDAQIVSRRGTDLTEVFPDLTAALRDAVPDGTLLDCEVVVYRDGRLSFDALQQRMSHGHHQAARLARAEPASLVAFDIMLDAGEDIRTLSWDQRRHRLDAISAEWRPPLQITPYTADHPVAQEWMTSLAPMGIEGIVAKRRFSRYGSRGTWTKTKFRETIDGVIGAVIGPLNRPEALIVGTTTDTGDLIVLGRTTSLSPGQAADLGVLLRPPDEPHPWPTVMGAGHFGGDPVIITHAKPEIHVEVSADPALQAGRRRHPLRYIRIRHD